MKYLFNMNINDVEIEEIQNENEQLSSELKYINLMENSLKQYLSTQPIEVIIQHLK